MHRAAFLGFFWTFRTAVVVGSIGEHAQPLFTALLALYTTYCRRMFDADALSQASCVVRAYSTAGIYSASPLYATYCRRRIDFSGRRHTVRL